MNSNDLSDTQRERLFGIISRCLGYQHTLIAWLQANNFPEDDPLYRACRLSVLGMRDLYLTINDDRRKGVSHRAQKRARTWRTI